MPLQARWMIPESYIAGKAVPLTGCQTLEFLNTFGLLLCPCMEIRRRPFDPCGAGKQVLYE